MKLTKQILQKLIKEEYDNLYGKGYTSTSTNKLNGKELEKLNKELLNYSKNGDLNGVKQSIERGADVNSKDNDGCTPLHWSSENGYLDIVKYLIDHGADVNRKDNVGWAPLHLSSYFGHLNIVKYLIKHGADVNCKTNSGRTPLHWSSRVMTNWSSRKGHLDIAKYLIERGANWNIKDKSNKYFIDYLSDENKEIIIKKYPKQYEKFLANKK